MPFVASYGSVEINVPSGQSIVVGSFGAGQTKVYTGTAQPAGNLPVAYALSSAFTQASATVAGPIMVRIDAGASMVEYEVGAAPQLLAANAASMPTFAMGPGQHILCSTANALTAHAGGGQGSALPLTSDVNRFTTVGTAADSAVLPVSVAGMEITVINDAASNSMNVFPATGEVINALSANTALAVAAAARTVFFCAVAGTWSAK